MCQRLLANDVPHSRVATLPEAIEDRGAGQHGMVVKIAGELRGDRESIRVMASPFRMEGNRLPVRLGPPTLGEANSYVIDDLLGLTVEP
jgi:crotonobetainyl-CoA:carnitine CoA-transferase CaiB-like acyl-CoA transferase